MGVGRQAVDLGELLVDDLESQLLVDEREADGRVSHERREAGGRRTQHFLRSGVVVDVGDGADPLDDLSVVIEQWHGAHDRAPVGARSRVAHAGAALPRAPLATHVVERVGDLRTILVMQRVEPSEILGVGLRLPGVRRPRVVDLGEAPFPVGDPHDRVGRFHQGSVPGFPRAQLARDPAFVGQVLDERDPAATTDLRDQRADDSYRHAVAVGVHDLPLVRAEPAGVVALGHGAVVDGVAGRGDRLDSQPRAERRLVQTDHLKERVVGFQDVRGVATDHADDVAVDQRAQPMLRALLGEHVAVEHDRAEVGEREQVEPLRVVPCLLARERDAEPTDDALSDRERECGPCGRPGRRRHLRIAGFELGPPAEPHRLAETHGVCDR